jgi:phosphoribosylanthranilate isomerase
MSRQQSLDDLYIELSTASKLLTGHRFITLLDSQVEGKYGGTGESFNWDLAQQIARKFPVIIAGGLTPANVGQLVRDVQPWGVDVSTGVESNGLKDISKIRAFVKAVRSTQ